MSRKNAKLLRKHFEVLITRDGAEIILVGKGSFFRSFLDENLRKYYPALKIVASHAKYSDDYIDNQYRKKYGIEFIALRGNIIKDLIRKVDN